MRVQSGAHRGSADSQIVKPVQRLLQTFNVAIEQAGPTAELLSDGQRHGILEMGAANFHHAIEFLRFGCDGVAHRFDCRNQRIFYALRCGNVHCRRKCVVGRLRQVGVHGFF